MKVLGIDIIDWKRERVDIKKLRYSSRFSSTRLTISLPKFDFYLQNEYRVSLQSTMYLMLCLSRCQES